MRYDLIMLKLNFMFKSIYRDKNLLILIFMFIFCTVYYIINVNINEKESNYYFGFVNGILNSTILRIVLWEIFEEKKKKLKTFLKNSGFGNLEYYLSYIIFGIFLLFVGNFTMGFLFVYFNHYEVNYLLFSIINFFFSINSIIFNLIITLVFTSQVQGINFITIINIIFNILPTFHFDENFKNKILNVLSIFPKPLYFKYLFNLEKEIHYLTYFIEFLFQLLFLLVIFLFLELIKNSEYENKNLKDTFKKLIKILFKPIFKIYKYYRKRDWIKKNIINENEAIILENNISKQNLFCDIKNICKSYKLNGKNVLDNLSCKFFFNEIFVVLGHNGAGKTTFINCLLKNLKIDSGSILYSSFKNKISSCDQENIFWKNIKVNEHIEFFCKIKNINYSKEINNIEHIFNFKENLQKLAKDISGGYKRRLSIALSYLLNTDGIFLDEPTTSLDLISRNEILEIIKNLRSKNKFILMTTHFLEEADSIASRIGIISKGKFFLNDSPNNLKSKYSNSLNIEIDSKNNFLKRYFINNKEINSFNENQQNILKEINNLNFQLKNEEKKLIIKIKKSEMNEKYNFLEKIEEENLNFSVNTITLEEIFISMDANKFNKIDYNDLKLWNSKNKITYFSMLKFGVLKNYFLIKRENNFFSSIIMYILLPLIISLILKSTFNEIDENIIPFKIEKDYFIIIISWVCSNSNQLVPGVLIFLEDMSMQYNYILYNKGISTYIYFLTIIIFDLFVIGLSIFCLSLSILNYVNYSFIWNMVLIHYGHSILTNYVVLSFFKDKKAFFKFYSYLSLLILFLSIFVTYLYIIIYYFLENINFNYFLSSFNPYFILFLKIKQSIPDLNIMFNKNLENNKIEYLNYEYNILIWIIINIFLNSSIFCYLYNRRFAFKIEKNQINEKNLHEMNLINDQEIKNEINSIYEEGNILSIENVSKIFNKSIIANQEINLCIKKNSCLGLLGPNGAGKTTLMSMISKYLNPSEGNIKVEGTLGICFQENSLYENMTLIELLNLYVALYNINLFNLDQMLKILELDIYKNEFIKNLSGGNKRKLSSLICILGRNNLIMMDEPTAGLDPVSRINFTKFIKIIKNKLKNSFLISTHYMREAEIISDKIAILINGQLVSINTLQNYYKLYNKTIIFKFKLVKKEDTNSLINQLNNNFDKMNIIIENEINDWLTVRIKNIKFSKIISFCIDLLYKNIINDFWISKGKLEQIFLEYCKYQKNISN